MPINVAPHVNIGAYYAKHIVTTPFREDGARNESGLSELMPPDNAFAAHVANVLQAEQSENN